MIQFKSVSKRFACGHYALKNISFTLQKGAFTFLTGHSGAGKSTILNIISMLEVITNGEVMINNRALSTLTTKNRQMLRRAIGVVTQSPQLLWEQSVFDNVALPMMVAGYHQQEMRRRTRAALDKVGLLNKERMPCHTLSTGEAQRTAIARAIAGRPALLLADEPTGNLDPYLSKEIIKLFESFNDIGTTVLIATHDLSLISTLPHRILSLKQGSLITPEECV